MKVLSLFDGIACGRVALERAKIPIEEYHAFEIDKYAIQTSLKNYPDIVQHGDVFKGDFTQFQGFDLLIGGSPCFTKGQYVLTDNGYKDIAEVQVGDMVLTHMGRYKPVIRTYCHKAPTKNLHIQGFTHLTTTGNHPFYTIEKNEFFRNKFTKKPDWTEVDNMTANTFCGKFISIPEENFEMDMAKWLSKRECHNKVDNSYSFCTTSLTLALQVQRYVISTYGTNAEIKEIIFNYPIYNVVFKKEKGNNYHIQNNIIWTPVKSVASTGRIETVYNIEVADDNSYTINNCIVHNCTQWSIAKRNRETTPDGIGGQLFLQYVRALKESKCKYFLYENNYSIHDDIKAFISNELGVQPIMINSALLSGQQRKRCYWTNIPNVTQPQDKGIIVKDILETQVVTPEKPPETSDRPIRLGEYGKGGQGQRIYSVYGKSVTMSANGGGQGAKTGLYQLDLPDGSTIIRKLTPLEAERCQTLPDNYTAGISDTQRYKCVGNGWTVDVIAHILKGLKEKYK